MLSNLRDGAIATYVATRPGCDAFIWLRQRQAEEQEIARAEAELGRLVRELAARKEEKMKASNPPQLPPKIEKVKSSGKTSKEKDKRWIVGGLISEILHAGGKGKSHQVADRGFHTTSYCNTKICGGKSDVVSRCNTYSFGESARFQESNYEISTDPIICNSS
jgi:hypothetical protein